jgi:hypothetical protein
MQEVNPRIALLGSKHQECKTRDEQAPSCPHRRRDHAFVTTITPGFLRPPDVWMRLPDCRPMRVTGLVKSVGLTFARWLREAPGTRSQPGEAAVPAVTER